MIITSERISAALARERALQLSAHSRVAPRFSVVIPVYNGARFIADALWSVQTQYLPPTDIIVVDDGSTDATVSIVAALAASDDRISIFTNDTNSGPSYSRNRGLRESRSEYVAFLDADDQWLPDHLESLSSAFEADPLTDVVYADVCHDDNIAEFEPDDHPLKRSAVTLLDLLIDNPIPQSAVAVRKSTVLALGGYRDWLRYAEDYDLWMRLMLAGGVFAKVSRETVVRTFHGEQASVRGVPQMFRAAWDVRRRAIEEYYGRVDNADRAAIDCLLTSRALTISAALNRRRRDLLELTLEITKWIPSSSAQLPPAYRLLGWQWHVWRAVALAYDSLPAQSRRWIRSQRAISPVTADKR